MKRLEITPSRLVIGELIREMRTITRNGRMMGLLTGPWLTEILFSLPFLLHWHDRPISGRLSFRSWPTISSEEKRSRLIKCLIALINHNINASFCSALGRGIIFWHRIYALTFIFWTRSGRASSIHLICSALTTIIKPPNCWLPVQRNSHSAAAEGGAFCKNIEQKMKKKLPRVHID